MCVEHPLICVHNIIEAPLHSPAWMTHVAAVVVHRCVTQALEQSIDPRTHLNDTNWGSMSEGLLKTKDIKMLWYYIQKEVCACMCNVPLLCALNCARCYSNCLPFICST